MKLFYSKGACSLVVRIIINEIGVKCEYESVNLKTKKTETDKDFLTINSKGAVPTLQTDEGDIITENAVILQYLADKFHKENLLPAVGKLARYRVLEWLNYITTELHKTASPLFNPTLSVELKEQYFIPTLKTKLNYVEKKLTNNFLLGEVFTLPDAYLFVILNWLPILKLDLHTWPNLKNFYGRVKDYPSVSRSLKEEGLA